MKNDEIEQIEDFLDIKIAEQRMKEIEKNGTYTHEEMKKFFNI